MVVYGKYFCKDAKVELWRGVEEFVAVVESGSMSAASRKLGVSVASVSRQLDALEDRLGVKLLKRTTRRQSLTSSGELLYARAQVMVGAMQELTDELRGRERELAGSIRISSAGGYVVEVVSPLIAEFAALHPRVSIELEVSTKVVDLVSEPFDLAIRYGKLADSSLGARKLFERRLVMCASPAYLETHGRPKKPSDLRRHACLLGFGDRWRLFEDGRVRSVKVEGRWRSNHGAALLQAAKAGVGLLYQPVTLVRDALDEGSLVEVMKRYSLAAIPVWAVYPLRRGQLPARVQALIDHLEEHTPIHAPRAVGARRR